MPTPRARSRREPSQIGPLAVVALAATVLVVAAGGQSQPPPRSGGQPGAWSGLVGEEGTQAAIGQRLIVVLKAPSLADRVARAGGRATDIQERRWTNEAVEKQKLLLSRLALEGVRIRPEFTYTRVLNGFSAPVDPRAVSLLDRAPEVAGVYAVRATYPAALPARGPRERLLARGSAYRRPVSLPGFNGRGVTIALLDTGVDRAHPYLGGRVRRGFDVVDGDRIARAEPNPDDTSQFERHGTETAGVLVGAGGPGGLAGVAPAAGVMPIRVAGWQRDVTGAWAVYGRSDQLIAGLERAVDPNGDGDAHDAARIAVVGVAERFAAFPRGPSARAVEGAMRLDTLVVVPAGNQGPAGPAYGVIAGPGGAPGALTVGAADLRAETDEARVVVRTGLDVVFDRVVPLAGAIAPERPLTLAVGTPRARADSNRVQGGTSAPPAPVQGNPTDAAPAVADFFDDDGFSLVAGRAALVRGGSSPGLAVENAARAGAYAVLLYGTRVPAGALGLDENVSVPVIGIPDLAARAVLAATRARRHVVVSIGGLRAVRNPAGGAVADFSSQGLAFDGRVKPELVAPGIGVPTSEPGTNDDGTPRFGTVNGTSVAAAAVAGAAAVLAQARPALGAAALKALLVGSARSLARDSLLAQGTGLVHLGAAVASEVAAEPASLAFETLTARRQQMTRALRVRNVSSRSLRLTIAAQQLRQDADTVAVSVSPRRIALGRGESRVVRVTARARGRGGGSHAEGVIRIAPASGVPQHVPWAIAFARSRARLIAGVELSRKRFRPSDTAPAVLYLRVGRVLRSPAGEQVMPVSLLEIRLVTAKGKRLGPLARLRDLLPGAYAFGLTGRGPGGQVLGKGSYRLEIVAAPMGRGPATRRSVSFRIIR